MEPQPEEFLSQQEEPSGNSGSSSFDYDAWLEEEANHQRKLNEAARNSPFFVNCDEEIFELNDDGSTRVHKSEPQAVQSEQPAEQEEDAYTYLEDDDAQEYDSEEEEF